MASKVASNDSVLAESNPRTLLFRFSIILIVSIFLGIIAPALVSYHIGTFTKKQTEAKLPDEAKKVLSAYNQELIKLSDQLKLLDGHMVKMVADKTANTDWEAIANLRSQLQREKDALRAPFQVWGFTSDFYMLFFWTVFYACVGTIVFVLTPRPAAHIKQILLSRAFLVTLTLMWVLTRWPTWFRNSVSATELRKLYVYTNIDISTNDFLVQEGNAFIVAFLVSLLWNQWLLFFDAVRKKESGPSDGRPEVEVALDPRSLDRVSAVFIHWQIVSIFLVVGFIMYTMLFWNLIIKLGDGRYLPHAYVMHGLWGLTWLIISLPLFESWGYWYRMRMRAMSALALLPATDMNRNELQFNIIKEYTPVAFWNLIVTGFISMITFLYPILQAILK